MNENKTPMEKFFAGKGFYIALALCVAGTGTAAWMAVNRTIDDIDKNNRDILGSQVQNEDFSSPEEVGKDQSGVSISSEEQQDSLNSSSSSSQSAKPSGSTASSVPQNESALQFTLPVAGEKIGPYSDGKLVKDKTLGEWRTHDGVDLKAAKGTPVYAAAEGTVTSVATDGLWGTVVKIEHSNGLTTVYSGLDKNTTVKKGDEVAAREQIGTVGQVPCELALEEHLHFAVQKDGKWLDPLKSLGLA
ncbi:MAG: M23 family metallopeptidase [Clostridiales bacterium]|nr:M23 family metallopeptidase [Clostridiales bacterium]